MTPTTVVNLRREPYEVYIGRSGHGRSGRFGNPFLIGRDGDRAQVIAKYRDWVLNQPALLSRLPELRGKRLGCFCAPLACHGDVLAELADSIIAVNQEGYQYVFTTPAGLAVLTRIDPDRDWEIETCFGGQVRLWYGHPTPGAAWTHLTELAAEAILERG